MSISVRDTSGVKSLRPVTGGIPLAQGAAPDGVHFALCDENDNPVPLQTSVLARWKDGSPG
ncbi:MAG: RIFT barrel domain-containing protein [Planctomycetota bacterium]